MVLFLFFYHTVANGKLVLFDLGYIGELPGHRVLVCRTGEYVV